MPFLKLQFIIARYNLAPMTKMSYLLHYFQFNKTREESQKRTEEGCSVSIVSLNINNLLKLLCKIG